MSKGGGSTRTINTMVNPPAYAQPFLEFGLEQAKKIYESNKPQYYPGKTTVGFSPESEMALSGTRQMALDGSPLIPAVQDVVMQNLMGTNPLMSAAFQPAVQEVQAQAAKAGRYGSGYQQGALGAALAPIAYEAQQDAIAMAPAVREFGYADLNTLAGVGAAREAQSEAELAADIERFAFEQNVDAQKLRDYMAIISGGTVGSEQITPQFKKPAAEFLGTATQAAGLLSDLDLIQGIGELYESTQTNKRNFSFIKEYEHYRGKYRLVNGRKVNGNAFLKHGKHF